jgi:hypothetical protein
MITHSTVHDDNTHKVKNYPLTNYRQYDLQYPGCKLHNYHPGTQVGTTAATANPKRP